MGLKLKFFSFQSYLINHPLLISFIQKLVLLITVFLLNQNMYKLHTRGHTHTHTESLALINDDISQDFYTVKIPKYIISLTYIC